MKIKLTIKKSKRGTILNVFTGIILMSFGVLFFNFQSISLFNVIICLLFVLVGIVSIISTLKNRKKPTIKELEVESWEEI